MPAAMPSQRSRSASRRSGKRRSRFPRSGGLSRCTIRRATSSSAIPSRSEHAELTDPRENIVHRRAVGGIRIDGGAETLRQPPRRAGEHEIPLHLMDAVPVWHADGVEKGSAALGKSHADGDSAVLRRARSGMTGGERAPYQSPFPATARRIRGIRQLPRRFRACPRRGSRPRRDCSR